MPGQGMMPVYHHASRQPFAGRSDNTMHGGNLQQKQPIYAKPVDSVRSLNEIALRDAEVVHTLHSFFLQFCCDIMPIFSMPPPTLVAL